MNCPTCHPFSYPDIISPAWCSIWRYFYNFPESITSWTMVCLNADRLISLTWPFWARRYLTERNTGFIIFTIVGVPLLYIYSS